MEKPGAALLPELRTGFSVFAAAVLAMGGVTCGYSLVVLSPAAAPLYAEVPTNVKEQEVIAAVFSIGAMLGCLRYASSSASAISDRYGRRIGVCIGNVVSLFAAFLLSQAGSALTLGIGRMSAGVAAGLISSISPVYIAESVPAKVRGACLATMGMMWGVGQILAFVVALGLGSDWRLLLALSGVAPFLQSVLLLLCLWESPRWLFQQHLDEPARSAMHRFYRGSDIDQFVDTEIAGIKESMEGQGKVSLRQQLSELGTTYSTQMVVVGGFMSLFSAGGMAAVALYSAQIMTAAGFSFGAGPLLSSIVLFGIGALANAVAVEVVDRVSRRGLLLSTLPLQAGCMLAMACGAYLNGSPAGKWLSLGALIGYIVVLSLSSGPMMSILAPELFPVPPTQLHLRVLGSSLGNSLNWLSSAGVGFIFLQFIETRTGSIAIWLFAAAANLASMGLIYGWLPETKGKTLEAIMSASQRTKGSRIELKEF